MSYDFYVGQKVVCVDDNLHMDWESNRGCEPWPLMVTNGSAYVISEILLLTKNNGITIQGLRLRGVVRDCNCPLDARRFRPLETKSDPLEIFRQMCRDAESGQKRKLERTKVQP